MLIAAAFVLLLLLPSYLAVGYYLTMVAARALGFRERIAPAAVPRNRFTIVIPAHDEADKIVGAIRSCHELDYPADLRQVVVVADNSGDSTAELAEQAGARCLRRHAPAAPGKGAALQWAFDQLLATESDAFVVLDADCRLEPNVLRVADRYLQRGARVLQTNHRITNADASPISYAAGVGRTLEYDLFFAPKSCLGLAVMLVGTGMIFHRCVLLNLPWTSRTCAEDTEYTIELTRRGERIRFLADARVRCEGVESVEALRVQRKRWASGNVGNGHRRAFQLMVSGLLRANLRQFDLGWTLLLISRPLVLAHLVCVLLAAAMLGLLMPTSPAGRLAWLGAGLIPLYTLYFAAGIVATGINAIRLQHLLRAPAVVIQLCRIAIAALFGYGDSSWVRTPRQ
jgi:cellulose synthase/poly-beta-1,6-N-acetylglucosamine synthase-like glycosyltransferase